MLSSKNFTTANEFTTAFDSVAVHLSCAQSEGRIIYYEIWYFPVQWISNKKSLRIDFLFFLLGGKKGHGRLGKKVGLVHY